VRIAKEGHALILAALGLTVMAAVVGWFVWSVLLCVTTLAITGFFRDPKRKVPVEESLVVSPADGKVVASCRVPNGRLLGRESQQVSIFMSPLDVHVNRSPIGGRVEELEYQAGHFFAAYRGKASDENEQNAIKIGHPGGTKVTMVQIAGFVARRIVCHVRKGDSVARGQRLGMIMFGSRVDLFLPPDAQLAVQLGDRVRGGETVVARIRGA
jgi:phosphatidylserine decarboxylase